MWLVKQLLLVLFARFVFHLCVRIRSNATKVAFFIAYLSQKRTFLRQEKPLFCRVASQNPLTPWRADWAMRGLFMVNGLSRHILPASTISITPHFPHAEGTKFPSRRVE